MTTTHHPEKRTARLLTWAAVIIALAWVLSKLLVVIVVDVGNRRLSRAEYPEVLHLQKPAPAPYPDRVKWWAHARFGLFIHWGPASLTGEEISWSRGEGRPIPAETYDNLYKDFNPSRFDPKEWVDLARAAGMGYVVFTAKHHDGFCMFDTALSPYKITNSPFGRDVAGELSSACHDADLPFGFYYSLPDWRHADYDTEHHERYLEYVKGQVRELCTRYGPVDVFWFDNPAYAYAGDDPDVRKSAADWDADSLFDLIRSTQPDALANDRAGLPGDFDTVEQEVGEFQAERPWEAAITLGAQWSWKPDDAVMTLRQCVGTLVRVAGRDGNLLLNVGPMPTGEIEPRQAQRLREIGLWLDRFGDTIRGTRGGPFAPGPWGASTQKDNRVYIHVLNWRSGIIQFPPFAGKRIARSSILTGGEIRIEQTPTRVTIRIPKTSWDPIDTILLLNLEPENGEKRVREKGVTEKRGQQRKGVRTIFGGGAVTFGRATRSFDRGSALWEHIIGCRCLPAN
ncbi:MAG: alpha-L-fucosidase [Planctomycetota bacterium]